MNRYVSYLHRANYIRKHRRPLSGLVGLAFIAGTPALQAADISWSTPSSGSFSTPANWNGGVVPGAGDGVSFSLEATSAGVFPYTVAVGEDIATGSVRFIYPPAPVCIGCTPTASAPLTLDLAGHHWTVTATAADGMGWGSANLTGIGLPPVTLTGGGFVDSVAPMVLRNTMVAGATLSSSEGIVFGFASSTGFSTTPGTRLEGTNTRWIMSGDLHVGSNQESGGLAIANGAQVVSANTFLAPGARLLLEGAGSALSTGVLRNTAGVLSLAVDPDIVILSGATVVANSVDVYAGSSFNGGASRAGIGLRGGTLASPTLTSKLGSVQFDSGTLVLGSFALSDTETLGPSLSLDAGRAVQVLGNTNLMAGSALTLDGGRFETSVLTGPGRFTFNAGTFALNGQDLTVGNGGLLGSFLKLELGRKLLVAQDVVVASDGQLSSNGGGSLAAGRIVNHGQVIVDGFVANLQADSLQNSGVMIGNGRLVTRLVNASGAQVRVGSSELMQFAGSGDNSNSGELAILGGTLEFSHGLTNNAGGVIAGRGTLIVGDTLTNRGRINVSGGITDLLGDVHNLGTGTIIVSGGATLTFFDDLVHNGSEIRVSAGSTAVYFGDVSGAGRFTGSGLNFFEGSFSPGNSPTLTTIEGDTGFGSNSRLVIELAGHTPGTEFDRVMVGGDASLGGELQFSLLDGFLPTVGDKFTFFIAGGDLTGNFAAVHAPSLAGLTFDVLRDAHSLSLVVAAAPVPVPSALTLMCTAVLAGGRLTRRRRQH